jgi:hypothetical protein
MVECDGQDLVNRVRCVSCICFVYSILDFGEQVDDWGGWVPLFLHHFVINVELLGSYITICVEQVLKHGAYSDPRETSGVVLYGL